MVEHQIVMASHNESGDIEFFDYTDISSVNKLSKAIILNDENLVLQILKSKTLNPAPDPVNNQGWNALHVAASKSNATHLLKLLLEHRESCFMDIDSRTYLGETPLFIACIENCKENVDVLLQFGCDVDVNVPIHHFSTALHIAAERGYDSIVKSLLESKANVYAKDEYEFTALHRASITGHANICEMLLQIGGEKLALGRTIQGFLATSIASDYGFLDVLRILIDHTPLLLDLGCFSRSTPIMYAAGNGYEEMVNYLLAKGCNLDIETETGCMAIHCAVKNGNLNIVRKILAGTNSKLLYESFKQKIDDWRLPEVFQYDYPLYESLACTAISSKSDECFDYLLNSDLDKRVLQAPEIICNSGERDITKIVLPLSYLFSEHTTSMSDNVFEKFLTSFLSHGMIHARNLEWIRVISNRSDIQFQNPFSPEWIRLKGEKYYEMLKTKGITVDYCLTWLVSTTSTLEFCLCRYFNTLTEAINEDDLETVIFFLTNSDFLDTQLILKYIGKISFSSIPKVYKHIKYLTSGSMSEQNANISSLKGLCRCAIRKELQMTKLNNINKFISIDALPLPSSLINYLRYKY